jgi:hypothetical protein
MTLKSFTFGGFSKVVHNTEAPSVDTPGINIIPGASNVKGSWTTILDPLPHDVFALNIGFYNGDVSATNRGSLCDIGIDLSGGTTFSVLIPDLLCGSAAPGSLGGGQKYSFPLFIPSGATVGARAQTAAAASGTLNVAISGYGGIKDNHFFKVGRKVEALGIVSASSRGTTIVSGATSFGSPTFDGFYAEHGFSVNSAAMTAVRYHTHLFSTDRIANVERNNFKVHVTTALEQVIGVCTNPFYTFGIIKTTDTWSITASANAAFIAGISAAIYIVR